MALSLNCIGEALKGQQRFAEAEQFFRKGLEIRRLLYATSGGRHAEIVLSLNCIGEALKGQQRFDEAEQLFKQSLEIAKQLHVAIGGKHSSVALGFSYLGSLFMKQRRFADAERYHLQALAIRQHLGRRKDIERSEQDVAQCRIYMISSGSGYYFDYFSSFFTHSFSIIYLFIYIFILCLSFNLFIYDEFMSYVRAASFKVLSRNTSDPRPGSNFGGRRPPAHHNGNNRSNPKVFICNLLLVT